MQRPLSIKSLVRSRAGLKLSDQFGAFCCLVFNIKPIVFGAIRNAQAAAHMMKSNWILFGADPSDQLQQHGDGLNHASCNRAPLEASMVYRPKRLAPRALARRKASISWLCATPYLASSGVPIITLPLRAGPGL